MISKSKLIKSQIRVPLICNQRSKAANLMQSNIQVALTQPKIKKIKKNEILNPSNPKTKIQKNKVKSKYTKRKKIIKQKMLN